MTGRTPDVQVAVSWTWTPASPYGSDEDVLDRRLLSNTLSIQYGRDVARPLGEPLPASASWQCLNDDRVLSPEWPGSPLYQILMPGRPDRIRAFLAERGALYDAVEDAYDAESYYDDGEDAAPLHAGVLEQPEWETALGAPFVSMTSLGVLGRLTRAKIRTPLYAAQRVDQAIAIVLDAVAWPVELRDLALADTTLDWFWVHDETPFEVLVRLQHTEGVPSLIWEGPDGVLHFEHRNYRVNTTRSNTPQAAYVDHYATVTAITPRFYHSGISYKLPFTDVYNLVTCPIVRRERQTAQKVWEFGGPLVLGIDETQTITATLSDPTDNLVALALGTDYTVSVGALASVPTFVETNARTVRIAFTAGPAGATVLGVTSDGPQIRATPVTVVASETVQNTIDTSTSIAKYDPVSGQPLPLELQAYPEISRPTAEALCDTTVAYYMEARSMTSLRVMNPDEAHLRGQVARRPSDLIVVISEPLGVEGTAHVEQISYRMTPEGLETMLVCERALSQPGAAIWDDPGTLWDSSIWGT